MSRKAFALTVAFAALLAAVFAVFATRSPELWPFLPEAPMQFVLKVLQPRTQEQVAVAEFIGAWVFGFVLALVVAVAGRAFIAPVVAK